MSSRPLPPEVPFGWTAVWDITHQRYYFADASGASTWTLPTQPVASALSNDILSWGKDPGKDTTTTTNQNALDSEKIHVPPGTVKTNADVASKKCGLCLVRGLSFDFDSQTGLCKNPECQRDNLGFWHCGRTFDAMEYDHSEVALTDFQLFCPDCRWVRPGPWRCPACFHQNEAANTQCLHIMSDKIHCLCLSVNKNQYCNVNRYGRQTNFISNLLSRIHANDFDDWIVARKENTQKGMSKNCCLTVKDCKIRYKHDMEKAGGPIAKKITAVGFCTNCCTIVSMFGTVVCFLLQYLVLNNVVLQVGTPFPMILENTCVCDGALCPEVLFTFSPPKEVLSAKNMYDSTIDYGKNYVDTIDYVDAWQITNAWNREKLSHNGDLNTLIPPYCFCDIVNGDLNDGSWFAGEICAAGVKCRGDLVGLLLVPPKDGFARKDLNDSHCWTKHDEPLPKITKLYEGREITSYEQMGCHTGECGGLDHYTRDDVCYEDPGSMTRCEASQKCCTSRGSFEKYKKGQYSSDYPQDTTVLVVYTTALGLFLAIQEVLNWAPGGHKCSNCVVKEHICIGGFSFLFRNRCNFISIFLAEVLYFVTFIAGYNVCLAMFLSPGEDLTGYDKEVVENLDYQGARLWESTVDTKVADLIFIIAYSFGVVAVVEFFYFALCRDVENKEPPVHSLAEGKKRLHKRKYCGRDTLKVMVQCTRIVAYSAFGYNFLQLSIVLIKKQIDALNGIAIFIPVDFYMIHINFSMALTISFSFTMAISRFASTFLNGATRLSRLTSQRLKSMKNSRKIMLHNSNPSSVAQETVKEQVQEQVEDKVVKTVDQKIVEQREDALKKKKKTKVTPAQLRRSGSAFEL